jgi:hypothetical protein
VTSAGENDTHTHTHTHRGNSPLINRTGKMVKISLFDVINLIAISYAKYYLREEQLSTWNSSLPCSTAIQNVTGSMKTQIIIAVTLNKFVIIFMYTYLDISGDSWDLAQDILNTKQVC